MSLSWKDEQNNHTNSSGTFGRDIRLETPSTNYVPPAVSQPMYNHVPPKEKRKCWLLRPVAWLVFLVSVYLMNIVINTGILLGAYVVEWLSTLPTGAIILLTLAFGSIAIGVLFSGAVYLPVLTITLTNKIYPSKSGVRYYLVGAIQLLTSLLAIILTLANPDAEFVFWDCATSVYFAIVYIFMLCSVKSCID